MAAGPQVGYGLTYKLMKISCVIPGTAALKGPELKHSTSCPRLLTISHSPLHSPVFRTSVPSRSKPLGHGGKPKPPAPKSPWAFLDAMRPQVSGCLFPYSPAEALSHGRHWGFLSSFSGHLALAPCSQLLPHFFLKTTADYPHFHTHTKAFFVLSLLSRISSRA